MRKNELEYLLDSVAMEEWFNSLCEVQEKKYKTSSGEEKLKYVIRGIDGKIMKEVYSAKALNDYFREVVEDETV